MFKVVLLLLTLSAFAGLQARPLAVPRRLQKTYSTYQLPHDFRQGTEHYDIRRTVPAGFRQGTEPSRRIIVDLNTGRMQEHISEMERRVDFTRTSLGNREMERRHWLTDEVTVDVPAERSGAGWVRVEELSAPRLPDGFRQGTEPVLSASDVLSGQETEPIHMVPDGFRQETEPIHMVPHGFRQETEPIHMVPDGFRQGTEPSSHIPEGFRQGTEPSFHIPEGFRQGTEPSSHIPEGFRQGTEPSSHIPEGFRQGTEPSFHIPEGFRQGTEPSSHIPEGFRQGTEPSSHIPEGFRQGTEPSSHIPEGFRQGTEPSTNGRKTQTVACKGEVINGNCYEFNPNQLAFQEAQALCRALAPNAELASVTSGDLHSRLVSLVTKGGKNNPVLTWLGGTVKNQQGSWVDGSEWSYSDWMPGHPNIHTDKPVCVAMFKMDESWWTANDCELKRASICSYPITA
uniref:C-type lectin domain-containing protein n=1 Tax=Sparus aurata TaxID=8175 RepID=A0A671YZC6_SPAAU